MIDLITDMGWVRAQVDAAGWLGPVLFMLLMLALFPLFREHEIRGGPASSVDTGWQVLAMNNYAKMLAYSFKFFK